MFLGAHTFSAVCSFAVLLEVVRESNSASFSRLRRVSTQPLPYIMLYRICAVMFVCTPSNAHHQWNFFKQRNIIGLGFVCGRGDIGRGERLCVWNSISLCVCVCCELNLYSFSSWRTFFTVSFQSGPNN